MKQPCPISLPNVLEQKAKADKKKKERTKNTITWLALTLLCGSNPYVLHAE
jgi:hypothetical protein